MVRFGPAVALFLPGVAYLGITNGHDFIENDFFAFMDCVASVGFASVPLLSSQQRQLVRRPGHRPDDVVPVAVHDRAGVAYSGRRWVRVS